MWTRWNDIDRELAAVDELQRRLTRSLGEAWLGRALQPGMEGLTPVWPRANLYDTGSTLTVVIQAPGMTQEDLNVEVLGDIVTVSGQRKAEPPEGYQVHRRERGAKSFSRSFSLPCPVDPERTSARLADGLLTVTMEKHLAAQPRKIEVSVG